MLTRSTGGGPVEGGGSSTASCSLIGASTWARGALVLHRTGLYGGGCPKYSETHLSFTKGSCGFVIRWCSIKQLDVELFNDVSTKVSISSVISRSVSNLVVNLRDPLSSPPGLRDIGNFPIENIKLTNRICTPSTDVLRLCFPK